MSRTNQDWEQRRLLLIENACHRLTAIVADGVPVRRAVQRVVRAYHGRPLGSGRFLKASEPTLIRLWYAWRKAGKSRDALRHRYPPPRNRVVLDEQMLRAMWHAAIHIGATVAMIHRAFGGTRRIGLSVKSLARRIPRDVIKAARKQRDMKKTIAELEKRIFRGELPLQ